MVQDLYMSWPDNTWTETRLYPLVPGEDLDRNGGILVDRLKLKTDKLKKLPSDQTTFADGNYRLHNTTISEKQ